MRIIFSACVCVICWYVTQRSCIPFDTIALPCLQNMTSIYAFMMIYVLYLVNTLKPRTFNRIHHTLIPLYNIHSCNWDIEHNLHKLGPTNRHYNYKILAVYKIPALDYSPEKFTPVLLPPLTQHIKC